MLVTADLCFELFVSAIVDLPYAKLRDRLEKWLYSISADRISFVRPARVNTYRLLIETRLHR